ncbi:DUF349 domain-containing protein [Bogoriella caseilytica]|uniref:Uncharacterized protein DUF349 n=1 Tax=Bogoriella caseilytica TaxID=56055 RepID=A0A3N2BGF0_9MICO|nr:DUF349 domain-containing protein [Bogoriella caseilytica]ROR74332.1 uncharacterized protein DUF349 [Bogoriella caseilytica]
MTDQPTPRPTPRPSPATVRPKPAARPAASGQPAARPPAPPVDQQAAAEAAKWGRAEEDGTVYVREAAGERSVGQYTGADTSEALAFYVRRYLDIHAQVVLFETRLPQLGPGEIDQTLKQLTEAAAAPAAVGDLDGLRAHIERLREAGEARKSEVAAERQAAKAEGTAQREALVTEAEKLAAQDPQRIQWKQTGQRMRELFEEWKKHQQSGPRLDRPVEESLWKRFSAARTTFDKNRRQFFAELDAKQNEVKAAKEKLIKRAEELNSSTDWGRTTIEYRSLMDEWKAAGRASRKEDDALWERFRAAQQVFFDARNAENEQIDAEYKNNLTVKLAILEEAEALLPVSDPKAAREALRPIQDRWEDAGKVPRDDVKPIEARMRAVEQAIRDAEQAEWDQSNPESKARAEGPTAQLREEITKLEAELEAAQAAEETSRVASLQEQLTGRKNLLQMFEKAAG